MSDKPNEQFREERLRPSERRSRGPEEQTGFPNPGRRRIQKQIRPILDQVYVHAEHIIGIENVETMLSELKAVHNVLENI